jgi:ectoine hydroxylase-related dioxygenase (phytanoyl-CoA dioxygenase family)
MVDKYWREQWDRDGYIIVENALDSVGLDSVRSAYEAIEADQAPAWRESVIDGTYGSGYGNGPDAHTMRNIQDYDDIFLDLAENPLVTPIIKDVVGENFQVMEMICHNHHSGTKAHTGWHRDWPPYRHPQFSLKVKVFYFLDNQDEDMGCFSLVPGSQKFDANPDREKYTRETLTDMPNTTKMVGKAGSAVIWDVTCWHTGLANVSEKDRRLVIYGYMPFWAKKWEAKEIPQSILTWANTPMRRQIMGIHAVHGRNAWDRTDIDRLPDQDKAFKDAHS